MRAGEHEVDTLVNWKHLATFCFPKQILQILSSNIWLNPQFSIFNFSINEARNLLWAQIFHDLKGPLRIMLWWVRYKWFRNIWMVCTLICQNLTQSSLEFLAIPRVLGQPSVWKSVAGNLNNFGLPSTSACFCILLPLLIFSFYAVWNMY